MKKSFRQLVIAMVASGVAVSTAVHADPTNNMALVPPADLTEVARQSGLAMRSPPPGEGQLGFLEAFEGNPPVQVLRASFSYRVNVADLDLASQDGLIALEGRVKDAANAACEELEQRFSQMTPSVEDCAKLAADKAMVTARKLIAKAREKLPHQLSSTVLRPEAGREVTSTVIAGAQ